MNRYHTPSPRKAFALASIGLTAITLGLAVIVPAKVGAADPEIRTLAPIEVVARPSAVDVGRVPAPEVVSVRVSNPPAKRKQES